MLSGEFNHLVDAKNRLFVPAKLREELGSSFVITRSLRDSHLMIFSMAGWEAYITPILTKDRVTSERAMRFLHRYAITAEPDSQGRVVLTPALLEYAGINKEVVIVGCYNHAEIWSRSAYAAQMADEDPGEICDSLEVFGL